MLVLGDGLSDAVFAESKVHIDWNTVGDAPNRLFPTISAVLLIVSWWLACC